MEALVDIVNNGVSAFDVGSGGGVTWIGLVTGPKITPTFLETIGDGDVWEYTYTTALGGGDTVYYRLIPSGAVVDSFYTTFVASVLSGLVVAKATEV